MSKRDMTVSKLSTAMDLFYQIGGKKMASIWVYQRTTGQILFVVFRKGQDFYLSSAPDVEHFARVEV